MPFTEWYGVVLAIGLVCAVGVAVSGMFVSTPYGRFASKKLGPEMPIRLGWAVMESPALPVFFAMVALGTNRSGAVVALSVLWALHYANRSIAFPWLMRATPDSRMSVSIPATGVPVVIVHGWLYGTWIGGLGTHLEDAWLGDPRFLVGATVWALGFGLILHSEHLLRRLRDARDEGGPRYLIPRGGGFRWVSSPHYLGEILAFTGMAVASWCPGGLFVLAMTLANLVPRARATHRWYHRHFDDYPPERRALVPFLW